MSIDGYATLAINEKGDKARVVSHFSHDARLETHLEWTELGMEEVLIPNGLSDCLVMVFFSYHAFQSGGWEYTEWEEALNIENHVVIQEKYKEFERLQISFMVSYDGLSEYPREFDDQEKEWFDEIIEDWQMLHDEDFTISERYLIKEV